MLGLGVAIALVGLSHFVPSPVSAASPPPAFSPGESLTDIRVGLATDLETVGLCCDAKLTVRAPRPLTLDRGVEIKPETSERGRATYRLQVAALKDEQQAERLARRLGRETSQPADALFDADRDLYKVRVGRYRSPAEANALRGRLAALGVEQAFVITEGGATLDAALIVEQAGRRQRIAGRWLIIEAPRDVGIPFGRGHYRGRLLIFVNDRGMLNVINELPIEDYLRGVVPREMGPELYNQIEALKAQSVAARTFTLRNLGEFAAEGYDICSTPRCQVYGGMGAEHHRSDRAIADTAGLVVLVDDEPAEIFYSATCGGHTENVEIVFPKKRGIHLRGMPCFEAGATTLDDTTLGNSARGDTALGARTRADASFASRLARELLPPPPGRADRALAARFEHLALVAGLPSPTATLASMAGADVHRFLASFLDLVLDTRLLGDPATLSELAARSAASTDLRDADRRLARVFHSVLYEPPGRSLDPDDVDRLLFELARYLGVLAPEPAGYLQHDKDALVVKIAGRVERLELTQSIALGTLSSGNSASAEIIRGDLELVPGDQLELYRYRGRLLGVTQPPLRPPIRLGSRAELASWQRTRSRAEVRQSVQGRYPGFPFDNFQVLSRGVSGRVSSLRLLGSDGRSLLVDGLAVRWTLNLPDTWFRSEPTASGWVFNGNGWGHGVGMCQAGSFGMAARGADHKRILDHYFTGVRLGRPTSWTGGDISARFGDDHLGPPSTPEQGNAE